MGSLNTLSRIFTPNNLNAGISFDPRINYHLLCFFDWWHESLWSTDWTSAAYGSVATLQHTWWRLSSNLDCVQEFFSLFRWLSDHASNVCILEWHDCCQRLLFRLPLFHMRHHYSRIFSQFSAENCANSGLSLPQSRFLRMSLRKKRPVKIHWLFCSFAVCLKEIEEEVVVDTSDQQIPDQQGVAATDCSFSNYRKHIQFCIQPKLTHF